MAQSKVLYRDGARSAPCEIGVGCADYSVPHFFFRIVPVKGSVVLDKFRRFNYIVCVGGSEVHSNTEKPDEPDSSFQTVPHPRSLP